MSSGFQTFIPEDATSATARPSKAEPAEAFYLYYDPQRWDVLGDRVRPLLGKLPFVPGINGVDLSPARAGQKRKIMMGLAKSELAEKGRKVIPWDAVPDKYADAAGQKSYLRRPDGRPDLTITIFETTYSDSAIIDSDSDAYHEWLDWLMETGHIPECPEYKLRDLLSRKVESELRLADTAARYPSAIPDHENAKRARAVVEKAIEARGGKSSKPQGKRAAKAAAFTPEAE